MGALCPALEKLDTLLAITAFPIQLLHVAIQLLHVFKLHLLSTLYLNKVFSS